MGLSQSQIDIPFEDIFKVYSNIDDETSTVDSKDHLSNLSKSFKITVNGTSSGTTPIKKKGYEKEIDELVTWVQIHISGEERYRFRLPSKEIVCKKDMMNDILQTKEDADTIVKDGINRNFLGHFLVGGVFKCIFISFNVTEKGSFEFLISHFSVRDYQLKHFLQDMYSAFRSDELSSLWGTDCAEDFYQHYLNKLDEQQIEKIEGYYRII